MQATLLETIDVGNTLGEGVLYRSSDNTVWWTDIHESKLYCLAWPSLKIMVYDTPERVCAFSFIEGIDDILLVGFETGIALYTPETSKQSWLYRIYDRGCGVRLNDGRTDPAGRFWIGSMVEQALKKGETPTGQLFCINTQTEDRLCSVRDGIHISNGLCWSPDHQTIYFTDTPTGMIQRASYDIATGSTGAFEDFYTVKNGGPDGAIVEASGIYCSAIWGGNRIEGVSPQGQKAFEIDLECSQPTCLALGGETGSSMFITSASEDLPKDGAGTVLERKAGSLFIFETDMQACTQSRVHVSPFFMERHNA